LKIFSLFPAHIWKRTLTGIRLGIFSSPCVTYGTLCRHELFNRTYDKALSVALATGAQPETMLVEPIPPGWRADGIASEGRDTWITKILTAYGDVTPSMLQDIRRGRRTEIEFINGYVVNMARQFELDAPINAAIVETVHAITSGRLAPNPGLLAQVLQARTHK
jgi:2-dehydropantoate 2-reductase